jgi:O-antigen/teichoic acid export membrane protein
MTPTTVEQGAASLSLGEASVRRNIVSTLLGNLAFSGTQWLLTVVIARLGNMAMVGQYALGLAVCTPIFLLTGLQIRAVQATDCTGAYRFHDYLTVRIVGTACALLAVAAVSGLMPWKRETVLVVLAVALAKAVESFSDLLYGLFQLRDRLDLIARAMAIRGLGGLIALALSMAVFHNVALAVAALAVLWLAALLIYERPIALAFEGGQRSTPPRQESVVATCRRLAIRCLPLAFVLLLLSATISLPRMMLERDAGDQALGVFSAVATMSGAVGLIYSALGQTALPRLARMFVSDRGQFRNAMGRMMLFSAVVGSAVLAGAWFWGVRVITLVYGRQATVTAQLVTGLAAVGILSNTSLLLGAGLTASGRFWSQLVAALLIFLMTAAASALLIPGWGSMGAMYAGLVGACLQFATYGYLCWQEP